MSCLPSVLLSVLGLQLCFAGTTPAGAKASVCAAAVRHRPREIVQIQSMPHGHSSLVQEETKR